jgi:hypothetical protein
MRHFVNEVKSPSLVVDVSSVEIWRVECSIITNGVEGIHTAGAVAANDGRGKAWQDWDHLLMKYLNVLCRAWQVKLCSLYQG